MSVQNEELKKIGQRVVRLGQLEQKEDNAVQKIWHRTQRWFWMLMHEFDRDSVNIRAQSLAYLTIFSLLPLVAGAFFVFTFLAQFGMVQDSIQTMLANFLGTIPMEHRESINAYIIHFKDAYLANVTRASGSVGIFAILILGWVGLQMYSNIDTTLNAIWSSDRSRPFHERVGSFIIVVVLAPIVVIGGFSVPLILQRFPVTRFLLERIPVLGVLLNYVIPYALVFGIFLVMYRFVPVRRVWWKSAIAGAGFATLGLILANIGMRIYFHYGTNSAYGKAAAVPLVGFWIYLLWIVIILGAEVSFLFQNAKDIFIAFRREPALREGEGVLSILAELYRAHHKGLGAVSFERLQDIGDLNSRQVRSILEYLQRKKLVAECLTQDNQVGGDYVLAREVEELDLGALLADFFDCAPGRVTAPVGKAWSKSLDHWTAFYEKIKIPDLAK